MTDERILGSGVFVERVLKEADEKTKGPYTARERKKRVEELILERCKRGNISVSELKGGSGRWTIPGVRAEITKCLVDSYGLHRQRLIDIYWPLLTDAAQLRATANLQSPDAI